MRYNITLFSFLFLLLFCFYTVQVLCKGESNEGVGQVLDPVLQLPLLYHKSWSLSKSYLHHITSSGPCPTVTSPITNTGPCPTVTSHISHVLVSAQQLPPLYHKYWTLSFSYLPCITSSILQVLNTSIYHKYLSLVDRFIPYITNTGTCHTVTSPISQVLAPILQVHPLYHKYCSLSYSYLTYITSTGFCPTVSSPISQVLVLTLPVYSLYHNTDIYRKSHVPFLSVHPLYHKYWTLSYQYNP